MTLPGDEPVTDPEETPRPEGAPGPEGLTAPLPEPPPQPAESPQAAEPRAMPGTLAIVGRGLDLNVTASARIRRASVYIGLAWLLAAGPVAAVTLAFAAHQGGFEWLQSLASGDAQIVPIGPYFATLFLVVVFIGLGCLLALSIDGQIVATVLIGGEATGRSFDLHHALALARARFWRFVRAAILVGVILAIPRFVINQLVVNNGPPGSETQTLLLTAIDVVLSTPFVYLATGIVLGGVGARESVRRSWRLARARWRLAFLIAIVNTAVGYVAGFALGAGADILVRLGELFGLGTTMGPLQIAVLAAIVGLAIVSIGSLVMTIAALTVAPQVVAFLGLTGYSAGLDAGPSSEGPGERRAQALISRPMAIALAISIVAAVLALLDAF
jgi:hypothetical protein